MNVINLVKQYILSQDKFSVEKEENLNITFKYNDLYFIFEYSEDDPYFYRLYLPGIFEIRESYSKWIQEKIDEYGFKFKVARLVKNENNVWALADAFVYSTENINQLVERTLSCLMSIYNELKEDYLKEKDKNVHKK